jgi:hypothetical protein
VYVSRGQSQPYLTDVSWDSITQVVVDKTKEERRGAFGQYIASLRADAVVDLRRAAPASAAHEPAAATTASWTTRRYLRRPRGVDPGIPLRRNIRRSVFSGAPID